MSYGPVLHLDDAVANKACALYSRAQARDYIDVDAVREVSAAVARLVRS
jgi:predicted nucleotidyltransferase component of viral defense system